MGFMGAKKAKKVKKEDAKARYDAKHPTVSFRVSLEEYERLNELRNAGRTFREIVLTGAGMIEREAADRKAAYDEGYRKGHEEGRRKGYNKGRRDALRGVKIGVCCECGKPLEWDLTDKKHLRLLETVINKTHVLCLDCARRAEEERRKPKEQGF